VSDVSDSAIVRLILADYAASDAVGKLNLIGGGLAVIGQATEQVPGVATGNSLPFSVVASVAVGPELYGTECAVELVLEDDQGKQVWLPGQGGGESQAVRIKQTVRFGKPHFPGDMGVPASRLRARTQWVLMFPGGLPLAPGTLYKWRVRIDQQSRDDWAEEFYVPNRPGSVIFG